ncbi:MAG: DNA methyltransferase [Aestuariivita sp.]|nr:DNA methyltransferase [Aestuariivita sp.]MCY4201280.1 DNA methyltransferase [Aestuariivita sp.]
MTNCNVPNRTVFCDDNIDVLRDINSQCIDLIYLDPPFNKNKKYTAPIGSSAEGAEFSDIFRQEDVKDEWLVTIQEDQPELYNYLNGIRGIGNSYNFAYLAYMAIRFLECRRVLKPTGSIYLHCDPTMSHYLKGLMDCIFGEKNFRNEIIWHYGQRTSFLKKNFNKKHDVILFYARTLAVVNHVSRKWERSEFLTNRHDVKVDADGREFIWTDGGKNKKRYKRYVADVLRAGKPLDDVWKIPILNSSATERTGYPTQKPLALLHRIIKASSNEGDLILDPFCGCATTCVAAEQLGRQWIGVDVSIKAYELVNERLTKEAADPNDLLKLQNKIHLRTDPPKRTDLAVDYREKKFVYVIAHPSYPGEYKVGIAKNWQSRLNAYQTSDLDRQHTVKFKLETPDFRETERHIHNTFPNKHEWVQGSLNAIVSEIQNFAGEPK